MSERKHRSLLQATAQVVAAYVQGNRVRPDELARLIRDVADSLAAADTDPPARKTRRVPAVPVSRSVTDHYIVSLEDGRRFRSLKRHLMAAHGLTPEQYRAKWNLPPDYPMVAPDYAAKRSLIGKRARAGQLRKEGTGRRRR